MPGTSRAVLPFFCLLFSIAFGQPAAPDARLAAVDKIFSSFNNHTPGCAVGVAQNGKVVLRAGYGMADLERGVPVSPSTVFESGSVAKQFTAAALMLLAQQGKISLDDPMRKYLPELANYGAPVTIRQVIHHTSGLREWRLIAELAGAPEGMYVITNQDLLRHASRQRGLNFDPGTNYSYTNTGFNISTILIERVLGKTFQEYTQEAIFGPLNMTHTRWRDDFRAVVPNRALAYGLRKNAWVQQTPIENIIGAGGLLTTVGDLLLWNENFTHAKVGGPEFVKAQQQPATLTSGRTITYAAGLMVKTFDDGTREVSHSGATGGYRTWLGRYPDAGVSVAVMCNAANAVPTRLGRDTARLWTNAAVEKPLLSSFSADPQKLQNLAGMYRRIRDNSVVELRLRDGSLTMENARLHPTGEGRFVQDPSRNELRFAAKGFQMVTPDGDVVFEKVDAFKPSAAELAQYVGDYSSEETASTLHVSTAAKGLNIRVGDSAANVALEPTFRDAFGSPTGAVLFVRDTAGKVTALTIGNDRVWAIRFKRI
jgi:CubicO group peptidase (beta-lactamase class C family)